MTKKEWIDFPIYKKLGKKQCRSKKMGGFLLKCPQPEHKDGLCYYHHKRENRLIFDPL